MMPLQGYKKNPSPSIDGDKPIHYPAKCMCCMDSGLVGIPYEVRHLFVKGEQDLPFICNRNDCEMGNAFRKAYYMEDMQRSEMRSSMTASQYQSAFDIRFDASMCEALHLYQQQQWRITITNAFARRHSLNPNEIDPKLTNTPAEVEF